MQHLILQALLVLTKSNIKKMKKRLLSILAIILFTSCQKIADSKIGTAKKKRGIWKLHLVEKHNMKDGSEEIVSDENYLYNFINENTVVRTTWGSIDSVKYNTPFVYNTNFLGCLSIEFNPDRNASSNIEIYTVTDICKTHETWTSSVTVMSPMGSDIRSVEKNCSLDKQ
jgi:hypothetical protein